MNGDTARCGGVYTRLAGFPESDLAEAPSFPSR
jgi:hypothetical protein